MKKEYKRLIITLVILIGIIGGMIFYLSWPLVTGKTMVLATLPIDPFDPLRGQYITINYEISALPRIEGAKQGNSVYVTLKKDKENIWRLEKASLEKPAEGDFIRGKIRSTEGGIRIEYGIEQYFFERNAQFPTNNLTVEIKVSAEGQARIVRLLQEGKPLKMTYQNVSLTS